MKKPKMVLFDFGGTLCTGSFDLEKGMEALRLAANNHDCATTKEMCGMWREASDYLRSNTNKVETPLDAVLRGILIRCGLRYDFGVDECGTIFDSANSEGRKPLPFIEELLRVLHEKGIRTAVISNNALSGKQLKRVIDFQIPRNKFEFIFSSADFLMCKPAPDMFEAAAKFARLAPSECWYCGDSFGDDVRGSHKAGMFAVHYAADSEIPFELKTDNQKAYAVINDWRALISKVAGM